MKRYFLITAAIFCLYIPSLKGQTLRITENTTEIYENARSVDNWFLSASIGGNIMFSAEDSKVSIGNRIGDNLTIMAGKWINPSFGIRFGISYVMTKGGTVYEGKYRRWGKSEIANGIYPEQMQGYGPELDMLVNLTNWTRGYDPSRIYNAVAHVGFGGYITSAYRAMRQVYGWYSVKTAPLYANVGLENSFRVSDRVRLLLGLRCEFISFTNYSQVFSISGGVSVNLGNYGWKTKRITTITETFTD